MTAKVNLTPKISYKYLLIEGKSEERGKSEKKRGLKEDLLLASTALQPSLMFYLLLTKVSPVDPFFNPILHLKKQRLANVEPCLTSK